MKGMIKKILTWYLCFALVLPIFSVSAYANEIPKNVDSVENTNTEMTFDSSEDDEPQVQNMEDASEEESSDESKKDSEEASGDESEQDSEETNSDESKKNSEEGSNDESKEDSEEGNGDESKKDSTEEEGDESQNNSEQESKPDHKNEEQESEVESEDKEGEPEETEEENPESEEEEELLEEEFVINSQTKTSKVEEEILEAKIDLKDYILQAGGFLSEEYVVPETTSVFFNGNNIIEEVWSGIDSALSSRATSYDVSQYGLMLEDVKAIFTDVMNSNPEYFYVEGGFQYSYYEETGQIVELIFTYNYNESKMSEYNDALNDAVKGADNAWSDMEKALYINDYLARTVEYDTSYSNYNAYGALVEKVTVCQGYALAFRAMAEKLELECEVVSSVSVDHAWNMVKVNGTYYHIDTTWNDPVKNLLGRACHHYFLKSTHYFETFDNGSGKTHLNLPDWVITGGGVKDDADDTTYDKYFWDKVNCGFDYINGVWYGFYTDGTTYEIAEFNYDDQEKQFEKGESISAIADQWRVISKPGDSYTDRYVGTGAYNGMFYYSTDDSIYTWNPQKEIIKTVFQLSQTQLDAGNMYGLFVDSDGTVYCSYKEEPSDEDGVYEVEITSEETGSEAYYVSQNGSDSNNGTEESPFKTLYKALDMIDDGGTIYICDNLTVNDDGGNDSPIIIEKEITIEAKDNSYPSLDLRAGGIIIGADVTFKNIKVGTAGFVRTGIAANGHKIELVNVKKDDSLRPLQIYGGTFIDYTSKEDFGSSCRGNKSVINVVGGSYEGIYAGSINGSVNLPVEINVSKGNGLTLGGIYAGSTVKDPNDTSTSGEIPALDESIGLSAVVNINVTNNANVKLVDGVKESNTVNLSTSGTGTYGFTVNCLDNLQVNEGTFIPDENSVFGNNTTNRPNVILKGSAENKATLDLSECQPYYDLFEEEWEDGKIIINNFTGTAHSILVLHRELELELIGTLTGNGIEFRTTAADSTYMPWSSSEYPGYSGVMQYNTTYILGGNGDGNFVITNPNSAQLEMTFTDDSSVENGWNTIRQNGEVEGEEGEEEIEIPKLIDFFITDKEVSYEEANEWYGVSINVTTEYSEEEEFPFLYFIPLKFKVTYTDEDGGVTEYKQQDSVSDEFDYYFCDYLASTASDESTEVFLRFKPYGDYDSSSLVIEKAEGGEIPTGTYNVEVTAPTVNGEVTRSFTLEVIGDNGIVASGDCGANGDNLTWELTEEGVLTISGVGAMKDYEDSRPDWCSDDLEVNEVVINSGVTTVGSMAFAGCTDITQISLPAGLISIGSSAFSDCGGIDEIVLPTGVTTIGSSAFSGCTGLKEITLPTGVTSIGSSAFSNCDGLMQITIPKTVITATSPFSSCSNLQKVIFEDGMKAVPSSCLWGVDAENLEVVIPDSVTEIQSSAFENCTGLITITLPKNLTTIKSSAFAGCDALTSITLPRSITSMAEDVFTNTENFTIYGVGGTYAEDYADEHGIKFVNTEIQIESLAFEKDTLNIGINTEVRLPLLAEPANFTEELTWSSDKEEVATVSEDGVVTGIGEGSAVIQVTNGKLTASITVNVVYFTETIQVYGTTTVDVGDRAQFEAEVLPENATNKSVSWSSSKPEVALVDQNGLVTALSEGEADIIATATDGSEVTGRGTITVKEPVTVTSLDELQSPHPYTNNYYGSWIYTDPGMQYLMVTFSEECELGEDNDYVEVSDGTGNRIGRYVGTELAGITLLIPGDTMRIKMSSDFELNAYGFKIDSIQGIENPDEEPEEIPEEEKVFGDIIPEDRPENAKDIPEGLWIAGIDEDGYEYTGKAILPDVRIYHHNKLLTVKVDYTISYKNNVNANDSTDPKKAPTITVTGKGNFTGKDTETFVINQKVITHDDDIVIPDITVNYNKKVQKPSPTVKDNGKTLKKNTHYTVEYPEIDPENPDAYKEPIRMDIPLR